MPTFNRIPYSVDIVEPKTPGGMSLQPLVTALGSGAPDFLEAAPQPSLTPPQSYPVGHVILKPGADCDSKLNFVQTAQAAGAFGTAKKPDGSIVATFRHDVDPNTVEAPEI